MKAYLVERPASGWCVFVMTPNRARESHMSERTIELFIVK